MSQKHTQSCPTLNPMDCSPLRLLCPWGFSRQEYWSGLPCPPPRDLPNPGIKLGSPTLQQILYPLELPRKPRNTGVGKPTLLQGIFPTQESNWLTSMTLVSCCCFIYVCSLIYLVFGNPSSILLRKKLFMSPSPPKKF